MILINDLDISFANLRILIRENRLNCFDYVQKPKIVPLPVFCWSPFLSFLSNVTLESAISNLKKSPLLYLLVRLLFYIIHLLVIIRIELRIIN